MLHLTCMAILLTSDDPVPTAKPITARVKAGDLVKLSVPFRTVQVLTNSSAVVTLLIPVTTMEAVNGRAVPRTTEIEQRVTLTGVNTSSLVDGELSESSGTIFKVTAQGGTLFMAKISGKALPEPTASDRLTDVKRMLETLVRDFPNSPEARKARQALNVLGR